MPPRAEEVNNEWFANGPDNLDDLSNCRSPLVEQTQARPERSRGLCDLRLAVRRANREIIPSDGVNNESSVFLELMEEVQSGSGDSLMTCRANMTGEITPRSVERSMWRASRGRQSVDQTQAKRISRSRPAPWWRSLLCQLN
jgi:hypothetical protein